MASIKLSVSNNFADNLVVCFVDSLKALVGFAKASGFGFGERLGVTAATPARVSPLLFSVSLSSSSLLFSGLRTCVATCSADSAVRVRFLRLQLRHNTWRLSATDSPPCETGTM